jgi:hypothetical protein
LAATFPEKINPEVSGIRGVCHEVSAPAGPHFFLLPSAPFTLSSYSSHSPKSSAPRSPPCRLNSRPSVRSERCRPSSSLADCPSSSLYRAKTSAGVRRITKVDPTEALDKPNDPKTVRASVLLSPVAEDAENLTTLLRAVFALERREPRLVRQAGCETVRSTPSIHSEGG